MKNIIVFFMAINTVISILSMEKAPAQPIIKSDYYSLENLKKLSTQKIEQHIPCYIFIDQTNEDNPDSQESAGVLLAMLTEAIDAGYYCMIVSHSLVQSFLVRKNPDHPYKLTADLFQSKWMLYEIPNTQFFLFIPKTYEAFYKKGFNTARMQNLTPLLPQRGSDYQELTRHISRTVYYPMFSSNQLNSIFSLNKNIIWDFVIDGHGAPYDQIAGLKPESINKLLHFFDTKLSTGVIYLISCYLGGTNLSLLDFKNQHVSVIHPYILIAGSIAEMTSHFHRDFSEFIKKYFNAAAHLEDRGESLNELLQAVNYFSKETGPIHGTGQLAQVWLPGGLGFQTFNIDKALFWLGNVTLKTHEEEHKPILIQNKQAVLLYPDTIGVPLKVSPYNYGSQALRELTSSLIPRLSEIYEQDEQGFLENFDQNPDSFPSLLKIAQSP